MSQAVNVTERLRPKWTIFVSDEILRIDRDPTRAIVAHESALQVVIERAPKAPLDRMILDQMATPTDQDSGQKAITTKLVHDQPVASERTPQGANIQVETETVKGRLYHLRKRCDHNQVAVAAKVRQAVRHRREVSLVVTKKTREVVPVPAKEVATTRALLLVVRAGGEATIDPVCRSIAVALAVVLMTAEQ
jgi:hypothetical protein